MSHKSVRQLIRDTAKSLGDNIQFVYARKTDFNQIRDKKYPFFQLELLTSNATFNPSNINLTSIYPIVITVYQLDSLDGAEDETTQILDDTDLLAQGFVRKLNQSLNEDTTILISEDTTVISNVSFTSFVKMTTDCLTGWIIKFNLEVPDDYDYCSLYE